VHDNVGKEYLSVMILLCYEYVFCLHNSVCQFCRNPSIMVIFRHWTYICELKRPRKWSHSWFTVLYTFLFI